MSARDAVLGAGYERLVRPYLFRVGGGDPERAHEDTILGLKDAAMVPGLPAALAALTRGPRRPVTVAGIEFPSVVGLAAGVDKDGIATPMWGALGFGHAELGTVTARPQPGNPSPRMFRLRESKAVINRMGFNNGGSAALAARLREDRARGRVSIPVGVSIGKTKTTPVEQAVEDYLTSVDALDGAADYLAVNVSSPNTPGLRTLQDKEPLRELLGAVVGRTRELAALAPGDAPVPVFVKLAPDLTPDAADEALEVAVEAGVSGLIATNTTLSRDGLALRDMPRKREAGGLSGAPLTVRAREFVARLRTRTDLPLIGVGGIMTADDAMAMLDVGADLVQVYTGFIYGGPELVRSINAAHARRASEVSEARD